MLALDDMPREQETHADGSDSDDLHLYLEPTQVICAPGLAAVAAATKDMFSDESHVAKLGEDVTEDHKCSFVSGEEEKVHGSDPDDCSEQDAMLETGDSRKASEITTSSQMNLDQTAVGSDKDQTQSSMSLDECSEIKKSAVEILTFSVTSDQISKEEGDAADQSGRIEATKSFKESEEGPLSQYDTAKTREMQAENQEPSNEAICIVDEENVELEKPDEISVLGDAGDETREISDSAKSPSSVCNLVDAECQMSTTANDAMCEKSKKEGMDKQDIADTVQLIVSPSHADSPVKQASADTVVSCQPSITVMSANERHVTFQIDLQHEENTVSSVHMLSPESSANVLGEDGGNRLPGSEGDLAMELNETVDLEEPTKNADVGSDMTDEAIKISSKSGLTVEPGKSPHPLGGSNLPLTPSEATASPSQAVQQTTPAEFHPDEGDDSDDSYLPCTQNIPSGTWRNRGTSLDIQHLEPNEDPASQDHGASPGLSRDSEIMPSSQDLTSDILNLYLEPTQVASSAFDSEFQGDLEIPSEDNASPSQAVQQTTPAEFHPDEGDDSDDSYLPCTQNIPSGTWRNRETSQHQETNEDPALQDGGSSPGLPRHSETVPSNVLDDEQDQAIMEESHVILEDITSTQCLLPDVVEPPNEDCTDNDSLKLLISATQASQDSTTETEDVDEGPSQVIRLQTDTIKSSGVQDPASDDCIEDESLTLFHQATQGSQGSATETEDLDEVLSQVIPLQSTGLGKRRSSLSVSTISPRGGNTPSTQYEEAPLNISDGMVTECESDDNSSSQVNEGLDVTITSPAPVTNLTVVTSSRDLDAPTETEPDSEDLMSPTIERIRCSGQDSDERIASSSQDGMVIVSFLHEINFFFSLDSTIIKNKMFK